VLVCAGCSLFRTKEEKSAPQLAREGVADYKDGKYRKSIKSFEKIKDWYPFSKYAILAELKIADAYFEMEEFNEAIFAYEEFENLHPRNDATPYVVYQIGMCYFLQIDSPDRDQSPASRALSTFKRLLSQFPESSYAQPARVHVHECQKSLAENEFYVGRFYYKSKHYEAAIQRFQGIVRDYPDVGVHHKAIEYIALCQAALSKQTKRTDSDESRDPAYY
jgi:outer membrane protein assembly factor BamD